MKINKIVLYNFSSFEGMNEFDFTTKDDNKNIILIGGKNGAGKTSLFTAIRIALYGPLAFGYVGINPHYIAKVKDCINSSVYQTSKVEAKVQLTILLMIERELKEYKITREWDYSHQKLIENFSICEAGRMLDSQELSYFQNYLQGMIPPDLFEFFLFDGEAVGSVFSTSTYNKYVRNAIYTLCGLDIFELIRKYTVGYAGKTSNEEEEKYIAEYEKVRQEVECLEGSKNLIDQRIVEEQMELEQIETEIIELETMFKNAGGITPGERKKFTRELEEAERIKAESIAKIKLFMEGIMPFYIVRDFNEQIKEQLEIEEKIAIYLYIQQKLNKEELLSALKIKPSKESIGELLDVILSQFKPERDSDINSIMYDLSKEETSRISAMMALVDGFDSKDMISTIQARKVSLDKTAEINRILKSSMTQEDAAEFVEKQNGLMRRREDINKRLYEDKICSDEISQQIAILMPQRDRARQSMLDKVQHRHVFELSSRLASMMERILSNRLELIKHRLAELIVENLKLIYRKNNLITHIEICEDFQLNLYQDAAYSSEELVYLMKNLGKEGVLQVVGEAGRQRLYNEYEVDSMAALSEAMKKIKKSRIQLYKKIDLNRLSKGERQIFILSLYWAIIKFSGKDIPFIIDTPYARIDANHRKEISQKFFPKISKQVIILSTDEEINEEYYKLLKPYIAREYLLINDENQNRTSVENRYFFGEKL